MAETTMDEMVLWTKRPVPFITHASNDYAELMSLKLSAMQKTIFDDVDILLF